MEIMHQLVQLNPQWLYFILFYSIFLHLLGEKMQFLICWSFLVEVCSNFTNSHRTSNFSELCNNMKTQIQDGGWFNEQDRVDKTSVGLLD